MKNQTFTALEGFIFIAMAISAIATVLSIQISIGFIWASVFGLMFGSYATSFVARMPRGIMQKKEDPYCMSCKHPLARRDLYTIFSYIINRGKCRFCSAAIPKAIFCTETIVTISYIIAYLQYGFSMDYIIMSSCYFFTIIAVAVWVNDRFIAYPIIGIIVVLMVITSLRGA